MAQLIGYSNGEVVVADAKSVQDIGLTAALLYATLCLMGVAI